MNTNNTSAVFFDLDGTLLDTAEDILLALNKALEKNNYNTITLNKLIPNISKGSKYIINNLLNIPKNKPKLLESLRLEFINNYNNTHHKNTKLYPDILNIINKLNANNIGWGIITNKTTVLTLPIIKQFDLYNLNCRSVVCADTTEFPKPHPAPMLKACKDLKVIPDDCVFIGDAITDIQAGKSVNMTTVAAAYGYIADDQDVNLWQADKIINSPIELVEYLNL